MVRYSYQRKQQRRAQKHANSSVARKLNVARGPLDMMNYDATANDRPSGSDDKSDEDAPFQLLLLAPARQDGQGSSSPPAESREDAHFEAAVAIAQLSRNS